MASVSRPRLVSAKAWLRKASTSFFGSGVAAVRSVVRRSCRSDGSNPSATSNSPIMLAASARRQRLSSVNGWVGPSARVHRSTAFGSHSKPARKSPRLLKLLPTSALSSAATSGWPARSASMRCAAERSRSAAVTTPPLPARGTACAKIVAMNALTC